MHLPCLNHCARHRVGEKKQDQINVQQGFIIIRATMSCTEDNRGYNKEAQDPEPHLYQPAATAIPWTSGYMTEKIIANSSF